ncbi:MAG: recombinase family protein [Pseudonocardiaceae bacterium]
MHTLIGYTWTTPSRPERLAVQHAALRVVGCDTITTELSTTDRAQLTATLRDLTSADVLVVWRLDRLARSLPQLITTIETIHQRNSGLWSLSEDINTADPDSGPVARAVLAALANCQHDIRREHTRIGLLAARERGRKGGRPRILTDNQIAQASTMKSHGASMSEIARALGVSRTTLYRHIT